jgi:hypothetical protein
VDEISNEWSLGVDLTVKRHFMPPTNRERFLCTLRPHPLDAA